MMIDYFVVEWDMVVVCVRKVFSDVGLIGLCMMVMVCVLVFL